MKHYPLKGLLGVNVTPDSLISSVGDYTEQAAIKSANKLNAIVSTKFSGLRVYVDADNVKMDNNTTWKLSPDNRGFPLDLAIQNIQAKLPDIAIHICYQNMPDNIKKEYAALPLVDNKPVRSTVYKHPNDDANNPDSFSELAKDMGVLALRGGRNSFGNDYPLYVSPNWWENVGTYQQVIFKGANLYIILEGINEGDNNWSNTYPLNAAQYGAANKKCYEAIKAVDPTMIVSSSGVMTGEAKMLKDIITWIDTNNGGKPIFDEYQCHLYPWGWKNPFGWSGNVASALPPEMSLIPYANALVETANDRFPIIIGEWGDDLAFDSPIGIRPFGSYTAEQIRTFWITRTLFGFGKVGIKRAYFYRLYQDYGLANDNNGEQFQTSSLFIKDDQDNITRRPSGDVFQEFADNYADFVFDSVIVEDSIKKVYRFVNGDSELITGWAVEKVDTIVDSKGTSRASFTENIVDYTLPDGTNVKLSSKPIIKINSLSTVPTPTPTPTPTPVPDPIPNPNPIPNPPAGKTIIGVIFDDYTWARVDIQNKPL